MNTMNDPRKILIDSLKENYDDITEEQCDKLFRLQQILISTLSSSEINIATLQCKLWEQMMALEYEPDYIDELYSNALLYDEISLNWDLVKLLNNRMYQLYK